MFVNWTDEDFKWKYDGELYEFKSKKSMYLPDYLARHFAKHLVDRELTKKEKPVIDGARKEMEKKCFAEAIVSDSKAKQQVDLINKQEEVKEEVKVRKQLKK